MKRHSWMICSMLVALTIGVSAQRPSTSSGTEVSKKDFFVGHIEISKPFKVRAVQGIVVVLGPQEPVAGALFELRDQAGHVRSATSNEKGEFALPDVAPGSYEFKVSKINFDTVIGKIVVSRRGSRKSMIRISLPVGT